MLQYAWRWHGKTSQITISFSLADCKPLSVWWNHLVFMTHLYTWVSKFTACAFSLWGLLVLNRVWWRALQRYDSLNGVAAWVAHTNVWWKLHVSISVACTWWTLNMILYYEASLGCFFFFVCLFLSSAITTHSTNYSHTFTNYDYKFTVVWISSKQSLEKLWVWVE